MLAVKVPSTRAPLAGRLEVAFQRSPDGRTYIDRQFASYPFHICRPHFLDPSLPSMATLYCQSVSGGLFAGDRLQGRFEAGPAAQVHVTTQASTIVHSMEEGDARQQMRIVAGADSFVEFLPDPAILFPRARLKSRLEIQIHPSASVICADAFLHHDPDGLDEAFGSFESEITVRRGRKAPLVVDRQRVEGADLIDRRIGVTGAYLVQGTIMVMTQKLAPTALLPDIRRALEGHEGIYAGASLLPGDCGVWARLLAVDGACFKAGLEAVWGAARVALTGAGAPPRRK